MIQAFCPTCKREIRGESLDDLPFFPFCHERCRLVDLARWADGEYLVSRPLEPTDLEDLEIPNPQSDQD